MQNRTDFAETVAPLAALLKGVDLADPVAACAAIEQAAPLDSELVQSIRRAAEQGRDAGWLLPKAEGGIRFGRVAKDLSGFSVDAVLMSGPGPRHRHPNGEIDLCFAQGGEPSFDGNPPGWTVYGADSTHVPTVAGGTMLILYFLPGAAIEFL